MLIGGLLLLIGFGGCAGVAYAVLSADRTRGLDDLDRRIALRADAPVETVRRQRRQLTVPVHIAPLLARAQIEPTPPMMAILGGVFALSFAIVFALTGVVAALITVVAMAFGVVTYVRGRARRRTEALVDALALYVDGVRQLMNVGNSLSQALMRALPTAAPPIQVFFGPAARRIELGAPIGESMQQLADRIAVPEIAMLAAAIRVNLRFGGSLAGILSNLSAIIRERVRIKRELSSATAEVQISAQILIGIPLILVAVTFVTNPSYRTFFFVDPRGQHMAIFAIVLQMIGVAVMMRLKRLAF